MGNVFSPEKPLKEIVRENSRMIKKAIREMEKEITNLKTQEKKLTADIKKSAKLNQMGPVRIMAKDLVRTRNYTTRFIEMKTHLNAVSLKMQTIKSHDAMATAMKGVTSALTSMNKKMDLPGLQKVMNEFMKENERSEMIQEVLGDTLDDAMEEEGSAGQEETIVNQVLDELGINMGETVPEAPKGAAVAPAPEQKQTESDPALSELEIRLNALRST